MTGFAFAHPPNLSFPVKYLSGILKSELESRFWGKCLIGLLAPAHARAIPCTQYQLCFAHISRRDGQDTLTS